MAIDGRVLASAGINIGNQIGRATEQLGQNVGGMLTDVGRGFSERRSSREAQELLQQYANDPAQLNALGQKYATEGNDALSKVFFNAAQQATTKATAGQQRGVQGGLMAITQAAARNIPLADLQEGVRSVLAQGGTQSDVMQAYKAGVDMSKGTQRQTSNVSPGGAIVDEQTGEVIYERPFKPEKPPAGKGVQMLERDDGSVSVVDGNSGELISTLPPTGEGGQAKQEASLNLIAQTTGFIQDIEDLMDPGFTESGFVGGVTQMIPGTPAYDREKELLSIRARLGFDQINEMKRLAAESGASGTGLGQISNIEFMSLQSTIDAIYVGMSGEAQKEALAGIKKHLLNVQKLAAGIAPADAIEWDKPEYKAVGYHKDPETGSVFYAPNGPSGTVYKLMDGKFVKLGA
jgi:hypothetical protein